MLAILPNIPPMLSWKNSRKLSVSWSKSTLSIPYLTLFMTQTLYSFHPRLSHSPGFQSAQGLHPHCKLTMTINFFEAQQAHTSWGPTHQNRLQFFANLDFGAKHFFVNQPLQESWSWLSRQEGSTDCYRAAGGIAIGGSRALKSWQVWADVEVCCCREPDSATLIISPSLQESLSAGYRQDVALGDWSNIEWN